MCLSFNLPPTLGFLWIIETFFVKHFSFSLHSALKEIQLIFLATNATFNSLFSLFMINRGRRELRNKKGTFNEYSTIKRCFLQNFLFRPLIHFYPRGIVMFYCLLNPYWAISFRTIQWMDFPRSCLFMFTLPLTLRESMQSRMHPELSSIHKGGIQLT